MALINCEALRQALFLYVSTLGFIAYHFTHGIWDQGHYNASWIANTLYVKTDRSDFKSNSRNTDVITDTINPTLTAQLDRTEHGGGGGTKSITHPPWADTVQCQTSYSEHQMPNDGHRQQRPLNVFDTTNSSSIPLNTCSTVHIQVPLTSVVWCGPTDLERLGPELHTLMHFLSSKQMDVFLIEGGSHYTGLLSLLALGSGTSVYVISPYSHYLNVIYKSVVLSKLPPRIFLYHNLISEIRGKVKLFYSSSSKRYLPNCDDVTKVDDEKTLNPLAPSKRICMSEIVTTANMEHTVESLTSTQQSNKKPVLIRASFANIHQVNGFLDSPEFFQRVCVQVLMVDISLLGTLDKEWLHRGISRMGYKAYTLNGKAWDVSLPDSIVVWTSSAFDH